MGDATTITTDRQIVALKPRADRYQVDIGGVRGLSMRIYPSGLKTFELRYQATSGTRRRMSLGEYPALTLSRAREKAANIRNQVVEGADPAGARAAKRTAARTGDTLDQLAESFFAAAAKGLHRYGGRPKRASTLATERAWWKHIKPELGNRRYAELKRADVKEFMLKLATDGRLRPASIASIGSTLSGVLGFGVNQELIDHNPALGLTRPLEVTSRDRRFDDSAVAEIWKALVRASVVRKKGEKREDMHARLEPQTALALRLTVLTMCRRTEAAGALWTEFDLKARIWTIPPERSKVGRVHVVPLTAPALDVLKAAAELPAASKEFVFPSAEDREVHIDQRRLTRAVHRICDRLDLPRGSPHDFRRSGATTLTGERYGISRFIVSKVLGHAGLEGSAVTAVYDRNEYLAQKRVALEAWSGHVLAVAAGDDVAGNIVEFRPGKSA